MSSFSKWPWLVPYHWRCKQCAFVRYSVLDTVGGKTSGIENWMIPQAAWSFIPITLALTLTAEKQPIHTISKISQRKKCLQILFFGKIKWWKFIDDAIINVIVLFRIYTFLMKISRCIVFSGSLRYSYEEGFSKFYFSNTKKVQSN